MNNTYTKQPMEYIQPNKIWNSMFVSIFFSNMAMNLGQTMSNSLLSVYANSLGASSFAIGMLMSTFAVSCILFRLISAPAMDTYNRKYIVIIAMLTMVVAFWGFGMSNSLSTLMVFRLIQGCGMAFGNACCLAMVADAIPKDKYGAGIGYYSLATVVCSAIGPSLGLWISSLIGYQSTFCANACIMLFAVVLASRIKLNFKRTKKILFSLNSIIAKEAILPSVILFLLSIVFCVINAFLILYANKIGIKGNIGFFFTVSAVTMVFTRPAVGKLTDKYGLVKIIIPALFCDVIALFTISIAHELWIFLFAAFISAFGFGACQPALQTLAMKTVTNEHRGAASSTNFLGMDFGTLIGPTIAGIIAQSFGYVTMWRFMCIPLILAMSLVYYKRVNIYTIEQNFTESM